MEFKSSGNQLEFAKLPSENRFCSGRTVSDRYRIFIGDVPKVRDDSFKIKQKSRPDWAGL
jgi:hypothetical protein